MNVLTIGKWKVIAVVSTVCLAVSCFVPFTAFATDFPGTESGPFTGTTATTAVNLKADESTLSFTAPTVINFSMASTGDITGPTNAKFTNTSVFDLVVKDYTITSDNAAHGVADVTSATEDNSYQLKVTPGTATTAYDFATNQTLSLTAADWTIGHAVGAADLGLAFSNGKMVNVTSGTWTPADGHALQSVVWTVGAA